MEKQPKEKYPNGCVIQNDVTVRQGTPWRIVLRAKLGEGDPELVIVQAVAHRIDNHYEQLLVFDPLTIRVEEVEVVNVNGTHHRVRQVTIEGVDTWRDWEFAKFQHSMNDLTAAVFRVGDFDPFAHLAYGEVTWQVQFSEGEGTE